MKWIVHNAVNRDVERQQLNKILSDISATIDAVDKRVQNNTNVQDAVGAMVSNNIETGISVDYDRARKVLNFVLSSYVLTLTGDVSGSATIDGSGNVTLDVELNEDLVGVEEAPIDTTAYWRKDATWEQVDPSLEALAQLTGTGFPARAIDDFEPVWNMRSFVGPDSVVVTNGTGEAGDVSFSLVNDDNTATPFTVYGKDSTGTRGWFRPALFESTGLLDGGTLSINAGDNTKFDVAAAVVGYTDYTSNAAAPTRNVSIFGPSLANAVPSLAVTATYVGIQTPGTTLVQQSNPFTPTQRRTIVPLGAVVSNGTNLIAVNNLPDVMRAGINQFQDLMEAIGPINKSGNRISANGANLQINKSAGVLFKQGSNFNNNEEDPHNISLAALTAASFNYRLSNGTQFATTTSIDTANYEAPLGTLADIPTANKWTIQRVYIFTSNLIRIQYGQNIYATLAEAESSIATEAFTTEQNIADNGTLIGFILVRDGATALNNAADAKFIPASKFGGPVGTGGTSILNTDSLPEGSANLYFTETRVRGTVLTGLSTASATVITAADTVLSAFGKLQAQVTANGTAISGLVIDSIADADTTHAPSRNAVFDALALKQPLDATLTSLAAANWSSNSLPIGSGSDTVAQVTFAANTFPARSSTGNLVAKTITDFALTILDDANAAAVLATIGAEPAITAGTTGQFYRGDKVFSNESLGDQLITLDGSGNGIIGSKFISDNTGFQFRTIKSRGSISSPAAVQNGDTIFSMQGRGYYGGVGSVGGNIGDVRLIAAEGFTSTAQGTRWSFGTTPIGSTTRGDRFGINDVAVTPGSDNTMTLGSSSNRWSATYSVNAFISGAKFDTGIVSMASLAADANDWAITNIGTVSIVRCGATGAARTITGIASPTAGQRLRLINITTLDLTLAHENAGSTAANRFACPGSANFVLNGGDSVEVWYDSTTTRWRVLGA